MTPLTNLVATGSAAVAASLIVLIAARKAPERSFRLSAAWTLAVAIGFALGSYLIGVRPEWPPRDDQDRLLLVVVPAALVVELLAAAPRVPGWLAWLLRCVVAFAALPALLYGTVYLKDIGGAGSPRGSCRGSRSCRRSPR